jgi:hypothetical protein
MNTTYQSRYLDYCRAHNKTPEEMLAFDAQRWPGGRMAGFLLWSAQDRAAIAKATSK